MDVVKKLVAFIVTLAYLSPAIAEDICVQKGPCSCVFSNGTGIDLSAAVKPTFYQVQTYESRKNGTQFELQTYYFHPCFDVDPKVNSTKEGDTCGKPLSICRHVNTMDLINATTDTFKIDTGAYNYLGSTNFTKFTSDGRSIVYANGPSETIVLLVCAETESNLQVVSLKEPDQIVLQFYSPEACLRQVEEFGRSFGSTLCIIFFSCVIFYLVVGVLTRKFLMGATGLEVVPNLAFWTELPNLVRDGWLFAINGFKLPTRGPGPVTTPDPNGYDSI